MSCQRSGDVKLSAPCLHPSRGDDKSRVQVQRAVAMLDFYAPDRNDIHIVILLKGLQTWAGALQMVTAVFMFNNTLRLCRADGSVKVAPSSHQPVFNEASIYGYDTRTIKASSGGNEFSIARGFFKKER